MTIKRVRPLMGTFVEITLHGRGGLRRLHACASAGFAAIEAVDRTMSFHRTDSGLSRLNRTKPGVWVDPGLATLGVLQACNRLWRISSGAFDPRVAKASARAPVRVRGSKATLADAALDLGGIAKGFAVDRAVARMRRWRGIRGVVNAGGDLRVWGGPARVSIRVGAGSRRCTLDEAAVATSTVGMRSDVRHRRMPSGEPLSGAKTAAIFAPSCLKADALTKVVLAAPPHIADRCLRRLGGRAVVFG